MVDAFDIRKVPAQTQPILRSDYRYPIEVHTSCDGLLLLSVPNGRFSILNPATRQWLALPRLTGAYGNIAGMYPHPLRSGEYCILFWRGTHEVRKAGYYVLTVGSSKNQKPKCIGLPMAYPCLNDGMSRIHNSYRWRPPVILDDCLHWYLCHTLEDRVLIFDPLKDSFRSIGAPNGVARSLLEMEGN
jgi:hypothetical protein